MASNKRYIKLEDAFIPEKKRRGTSGGRGGKNNNSGELHLLHDHERSRGSSRHFKLRCNTNHSNLGVAAQHSKSLGREGYHGTQTPVIIDLSGEEEHSTGSPTPPARAFMKPLPQNSTTDDFPCFSAGEVYVIIDPKRSDYQYRLHKNVLCRISPVLARVLELSYPKEAMEKLKIASTDANTRFELIYSHKLEKWVLQRFPFTAWRQPMARMKAVAVESVPNAARQSGEFSDEDPLHASKDTPQAESENREVVTASLEILDAHTAGDHVVTINVTNEGENDVHENASNHISVASHGTKSLEDHTEPGAVEHDEESTKYNELLSTTPNKDGQVSVDQSSAILDTVVKIEESTLGLIVADADQSALGSAALEDGQTIKREEEATGKLILSPTNEENRALAAITKFETPINQIETRQPMIAGIDPLDRIVEPAKIEVDSTLEPVENKQIPIIITSPMDTAKTSAKDIALPVLAAVTGPSIELCEAYNNLFLIFYSKSPAISRTSISIALEQCETLIPIATRLECLPAIRPSLAYALGQFGKKLYMSVAAEPFRWLKISMALQSAALFQDSMVHIVATYVPSPACQLNLPEDIPQSVRDLIIFKVRQLDQMRMDVNERLFSSSIVVDSETVAFSFVDKTIFSTWLVVQIWRDWFCREMASVHFKPDKAGHLYRTLAKAGDAYLAAAEVTAVIEKIREPAKADFDELREDLDLLKKFAQEAVKGLCENNSMVDVQEAGIGYLTCTHILEEELPWFGKDQ